MQDSDGRSKGCGLVAFANAHDAANAIAQLHQTLIKGRAIFVREDREAALTGLPAPVSRPTHAVGFGAVGLPPARGVSNLPPSRPTASTMPPTPRASNGGSGNMGVIGSVGGGGATPTTTTATPTAAAGTGTRVYVGNLSWETSWQDLKDHFRSAGEVTHADVMQDSDGRSKGCGLVAFANAHDAANAISTLHDSILGGRSIFVREDREAAPHTAKRALAPPHLSGGGAGCQVYVGNLPWDVTWQMLKDHFRGAGSIVHADVAQADGRSRGFGTILFATTKDAARAIQMFNETNFGGRQIEVRPDQYR